MGSGFQISMTGNIGESKTVQRDHRLTFQSPTRVSLSNTRPLSMRKEQRFSRRTSLLLGVGYKVPVKDLECCHNICKSPPCRFGSQAVSPIGLAESMPFTPCGLRSLLLLRWRVSGGHGRLGSLQSYSRALGLDRCSS